MLARPSSSAASTTTLLDALEVLRDRDFRGAAARASAWRAVTAAVRMYLGDDKEEDIRQEVLLAIAESVHNLHATTPGAAIAWVRAICRNTRAETYRRRGRTPLGHAVTIDLVNLRAEPIPSVEMVPAIIESFIARVARHLERVEPCPRARERRLRQAIACVRRTVLDESIEELRPRVAPDATADLIAKWVERGRALVIEVANAEGRDDEDAAALFRPFADAAARRRADVGLPRLARRRPS